MTHFVRWLFVVAIITMCLIGAFAFAQGQQQQAGPTPQAAAPSRAGGAEGRPATPEQLKEDRCWNRTPCVENHRPPVAFKEDWFDKTPGQAVDYKDTDLLRRFISDRGKIRSRRVTRVSSQQQRQLARAIKNAREMALLPYASR